MSRLPAPLRPLWPAAKLTHRLLTRTTGAVSRTGGWGGGRAVRALGTTYAAEAVSAEPGRVRMHVGGPSVSLHRTAPQGRPAPMSFFEELTDFEVPPRFVLEVEDGRLV